MGMKAGRSVDQVHDGRVVDEGIESDDLWRGRESNNPESD
jgi:hypothetical protein